MLKVKMGALGVFVAGIVGITATMPAAALVDTPWGPDRETFTWDDPAPYAVFNSITDNPSLGDERNFVRVKESTSNTFVDDITLERGKVYDVYIYYHNNADAHEVGKTALGIAEGVTMTSNFPATIKAGEKLTANATISALDTEPLAVWDGVYLRADEDLNIGYVSGSAKIYNGGELNGQSIGPEYLFGDGALLGYNKFSGMIPGCNEYAGYVIYQIEATGSDEPVTPTPEPEPTPTPDPEPVPDDPEPEVTPTEDTPSELPKTGPAEIIMAAIVVGVIIGGGFYWWTTRNKIKQVTTGITEKNPKDGLLK